MKVVYYAQRDRRIKIGTTSKLAARIQAIGGWLLGAEPGSFMAERERHRQFASAHVEGEWYRPTVELLDHIASLPPLPEEQKPKKVLLTAGEVARACRVTRMTVYRWVADGTLEARPRVGRSYRFDRSIIEARLGADTVAAVLDQQAS